MKQYFKLFLKFIRIWPLLLILKIRIKHNDFSAKLWLFDLEQSDRNSTMSLLVHRPYYIMILYHRLRLPVQTIFYFLFGSYEFFLPGYTELGGGVFLEHPLCSRLNAKSIGKNFKCYHNVTLGDDGKGGLPTIGDNVLCGAGCCVIGDIIIGNNVKIGANAVVTKNVPSNCTVVGNPAYIVKLNGEKTNIKL